MYTDQKSNMYGTYVTLRTHGDAREKYKLKCREYVFSCTSLSLVPGASRARPRRELRHPCRDQRPRPLVKRRRRRMDSCAVLLLRRQPQPPRGVDGGQDG
ncbi:hypothetical protein D1007_22855 [Hordeum vulgare]|nr:hypothetical protein D1007_22855 [Hordeum vulgare]